MPTKNNKSKLNWESYVKIGFLLSDRGEFTIILPPYPSQRESDLEADGRGAGAVVLPYRNLLPARGTDLLYVRTDIRIVSWDLNQAIADVDHGQDAEAVRRQLAAVAIRHLMRRSW